MSKGPGLVFWRVSMVGRVSGLRGTTAGITRALRADLAIEGCARGRRLRNAGEAAPSLSKNMDDPLTDNPSRMRTGSLVAQSTSQINSHKKGHGNEKALVDLLDRSGTGWV